MTTIDARAVKSNNTAWGSIVMEFLRQLRKTMAGIVYTFAEMVIEESNGSYCVNIVSVF